MKKLIFVIGLLLLLPALSQGQLVFNGFNGHPYWGGQVDRDENIETKAIISYVSDPVVSGGAAMRIDWGCTHDQSWGGGCYLNHVRPDSQVFDFSAYDSLIIWYYNDIPSSLPGKVHLRLNLGEVSDAPEGRNCRDFAQMEYWYSFHYILDNPQGWNRIAFPLIDKREDPQGIGFDRTGWYGATGNDHLDLEEIKGFQFEFSISATMGDVAMGTIILDEMMLVSTAGDSMVFLSFDGDPYWGGQVDRDEDIEKKAIISYVSDPALSGGAALRIDWGCTHDQSWGGGSYLNHVCPDSGVYDFSAYDSLIIWYYNDIPSSLPGKVHLRFNLGEVSDSPDGRKTTDFGQMEYWYSFNYILDDAQGWNKIALPLIDKRQDPQGNGFDRTGWYGIEGNDHLDLEEIKGFQFEFSIGATQGDVAMGTIILDEMTLVSAGGTAVEKIALNDPIGYRLSQNYPNPFNATTVINFSLPQSKFVQLKLYDLMGRERKALANQQMPAGNHSISVDASDLASGIYFYQIKAGDFSQIKKMTLVK